MEPTQGDSVVRSTKEMAAALGTLRPSCSLPSGCFVSRPLCEKLFDGRIVDLLGSQQEFRDRRTKYVKR